MTIWFYGDSWPGGCELEPLPGQTTQDLAFPATVGKLLQTEIVNKSVWGSSQEFMLEAVLDSDIQPGDLAVFCCTVRTRRLYRTPTGEFNERQFNPDDAYVNAYEDDRVSAHTCALLYYIVRSRGATAYFLNEFDSIVHEDLMYREIPNENWLIPKTQSILSAVFDPEYFQQWKYHHRGNFYQWMHTECDTVKKYIRPCNGHPNLQGHQAIAEFIVAQLKEKGHFTDVYLR